MKNKFFTLFLLVALVLTLIPVSVFAAKPAELKVFVRNTTGAEVDLKLTDADGGLHYLTIAAGVHEITLTEGTYEYYAVTVCGTQAGSWNLNVSKQLDIHCREGVLEFNLAKRCDNNWWGTIYSVYDPYLPFNWPILQYYTERDFNNVPDLLNESGPPSWWVITKGETICWSDLLLMYPDPTKLFPGLWLISAIN